MISTLNFSLKTAETLLGIETAYWVKGGGSSPCLKTTETLLGIETMRTICLCWFLDRLKTTETLLGIETFWDVGKTQTGQVYESQNYWNPFRDWNSKTGTTVAGSFLSLKTTETLLGIETIISAIIMPIRWSQNYWNPFRDWN